MGLSACPEAALRLLKVYVRRMYGRKLGLSFPAPHTCLDHSTYVTNQEFTTSPVPIILLSTQALLYKDLIELEISILHLHHNLSQITAHNSQDG